MLRQLFPFAALVVLGCGPTLDENGLEVIDARINVKEGVRAKLKDPASASFNDWALDFKKVDDNTFTTVGTVDAKNSFGGTVRTRFAAIVDKRGKVKHVEIDE